MEKQTFADRLNMALKMRNITAAELSKRSGASEGLISGYRKGAYKAKQGRLDRFAQILDVSIPWLMGYDVPVGNYDGGLAASVVASNIKPLPETYKVPRLGAIACGEPILAEQNIETYDSVPVTIRCDFTLICRGDSMIGAGIEDGDIVYIREQPEVETGEIAAVMVGEDEATLKQFKRVGDTVLLIPENSSYEPLIFTGGEMNGIRILGKAVGFTRYFRE